MQSLNIIVSGGGSGLGKALVKEFSKKGDNVVFFSKSPNNVVRTLKEVDSATVRGHVIDITKPRDIKKLETLMPSRIDAFINNAACSGGYNSFKEISYKSINDVVRTNIIGTMDCTKLALENSDHIFFLAGAGSDGSPTEGYSVYGATKAATLQFVKTLQKEVVNKNIHVVSPGMMFTPLLLENTAGAGLDDVFNMLCEEPDDVARVIVPEMREIIIKNQKNKYVRYMGLPKMASKLVRYYLRKMRLY